MCDLGFKNAASFRDQYIAQSAIFDDRTGQKARVCINGQLRVVEVERRFRRRQREIRLVERTDGSNILPVAIEIKTIDRMRLDRFRDDITPEIIKIWVIH